MVTEALAGILRDMRLSGGVFLEATFTEPWCILSQVDAEDCRPYMAVPRCLIAYHYVIEGRLILEVEGMDALEAAAGQILILPRNDGHLLCSSRGLDPADVSGLLEQDGDAGIVRLHYGGNGPRTRILCGFLGTQAVVNPLMTLLPPLVTVTLKPDAIGRWIAESMRYAMASLTRGGTEAAAGLSRLSELLFAEAIRQYVDQLPADQRGWLAGLRDPVAGKALALIHGQPGRNWTLDELAKASATSRSVLSERFTRCIGSSPIEYHRRLRLEHAADLLTHSDQPVAGVAYHAGFGSEAAFSRSFKRAYGSSPGTFRAATKVRIDKRHGDK